MRGRALGRALPWPLLRLRLTRGLLLGGGMEKAAQKVARSRGAEEQRATNGKLKNLQHGSTNEVEEKTLQNCLRAKVDKVNAGLWLPCNIENWRN